MSRCASAAGFQITICAAINTWTVVTSHMICSAWQCIWAFMCPRISSHNILLEHAVDICAKNSRERPSALHTFEIMVCLYIRKTSTIPSQQFISVIWRLRCISFGLQWPTVYNFISLSSGSRLFMMVKYIAAHIYYLLCKLARSCAVPWRHYYTACNNCANVFGVLVSISMINCQRQLQFRPYSEW